MSAENELAATVNSQFELAVGSSKWEKPTARPALTVATDLGFPRAPSPVPTSRDTLSLRERIALRG